MVNRLKTTRYWILVAAFLLAIVSFAVVSIQTDSRAKSRLEVALRELNEVADKYKIEVVTANPCFPVKTLHGPIDGKAADDNALAEYSGLFVPEFELYPQSLVARSRLKRVILCKDLSFAGQRR